MKIWQKILIPTLITLAIGGIYLLFVWHQRQNPGVVGQSETTPTLSADDVAVVRTLSPQHFEDLKQLEGTRVWMKNGYTMLYYPYVAGQAEFRQARGALPIPAAQSNGREEDRGRQPCRQGR